MLGGFFGGEREARLDFVFCCGGSNYARCDVFSERWAVLEAVTRTAADQPNVLKVRMLVNQEISVGSILVLADARFDDRRALQSREAAGYDFARGFDSRTLATRDCVSGSAGAP